MKKLLFMMILAVTLCVQCKKDDVKPSNDVLITHSWVQVNADNTPISPNTVFTFKSNNELIVSIGMGYYSYTWIINQEGDLEITYSEITMTLIISKLTSTDLWLLNEDGDLLKFIRIY